jgi:aerobic-type carbon monoxide dehydrogenase small subunit (CoxS/CutS family)
VELLRDHLELTGTKIGCNQGECGSCTVLVNGKAVYSCHILALDVAGKNVVTVEGLMKGEELHPVQEAFIEHDGLQCGYCTPGQIMAAQALLLKNPKPDKNEIIEGMSGNICRCAAYPNIIKSVVAAAENN